MLSFSNSLAQAEKARGENEGARRRTRVTEGRIREHNGAEHNAISS